MRIRKSILSVIICLFLVSNCFSAMLVDNYFDHPLGSSSQDNILQIYGTQNVQSGGTLNILSGGTLALAGTGTISGAMTYTAQPIFSAGINVDEDVDIDFDASDEEFNLTSSSGGVSAAMTITNTTADLAADQWLLDLTFTDNGDANGIFLRCRDNTSANNVLLIGADGDITIDASGAGSGTVIGENAIVVNDAAMLVDTETQDWQFGDGSNDTVISDNGAISQAGTATASLNATDITGAFTPYSRTEAELKALAPGGVGEVYFDSTNNTVIVSSGTGAGAFVQVVDGSTLPTGW